MDAEAECGCGWWSGIINSEPLVVAVASKPGRPRQRPSAGFGHAHLSSSRILSGINNQIISAPKQRPENAAANQIESS